MLKKYKLTYKDKQIIESNLWLNDIEAAQNILKKQYTVHYWSSSVHLTLSSLIWSKFDIVAATNIGF